LVNLLAVQRVPNGPNYPVIGQLERAAEIVAVDVPEERGQVKMA
jgi:hypothetical protein